MNGKANTHRDWAVVAAKGAIGAIPFVGPLAAEVIGSLIPNQRLERIESLLISLEEKLEGREDYEIQERFTQPEFIDLLEDGMIQASRSLSDERISHIAAILKNSLTDEQLKRLQDKKLLAILGELNDVELLLLTSYAGKNQRDPKFREKHDGVLHKPPATFGAGQSVLDDAALHEEYRSHLTRLGLLRPNFRKPKRGELPEFDDRTGMIKASGRELTPLGRLFLRRLDLLGDGEY